MLENLTLTLMVSINNFTRHFLETDVKLSTEQPIRHNEINQRKTLLGKWCQDESMRQAHNVNFTSSLMHTDACH